MALNHIVLQGRLVRDPEIRTTDKGTDVCNFTVAVDRRKEKDKETITDFVDCTAWSTSATFVDKYFHKGDGIIVTGRLESRKWVDRDGNNRVRWGVTVEAMDFPLGRSSGGAAQAPTFTDVSAQTDDDLPF